LDFQFAAVIEGFWYWVCIVYMAAAI